MNIAVNTSYPGAVKQDRKRCSSDDRESGTLTLAGIGGNTPICLAVLTRHDRLLRFTKKVPYLTGNATLDKSHYPLRDRHFR